MFDANSRYQTVEDATLRVVEPDGTTRIIVYKRRRFLPSTEGQPMVVEHTIKEADRLDNLTATYLGDPTQFYRLCDANRVLKPSDVTALLGRRIKVVLPQP